MSDQLFKRVSRRDVLRGLTASAVGAGLAPIVAACGQAPAPTAAPAAKPTEAAKAAAEPTKPAAAPTAAAQAPAKGKTELVYLNQSRGQAKAMETLAAKYTKDMGITVTIDSPGPTDYPKKLQASSQAGNMPDTYFAIGAFDMAPYYKAGWALNLKPELDKGWNKNFQKIVLDLSEYTQGNSLGVPPGIYHAAWEGNSYGIFYNPALLEKAKLDPKQLPTTIPDFLTMLTTLKTAKIGPFAVASEFIPRIMQSYVSVYLSDAEIDQTFGGKLPWKADAWKKTLQFFVDLRDAGLVFNNTLNAGNPDCEKSFFNVKELATFYSGVFSIPVQVTTAPEFTAYSAFTLPKAADGKNAVRSFGGGGKNGVVNAKGKNVDESLKYIKWLTEKEQEQVMMEVVPLVPTNPAALEPSKVSPQLKTFADLLPGIQAVPTSITGPVNEALIKGVQSILLKEKTSDQVLDDTDKAQKG